MRSNSLLSTTPLSTGNHSPQTAKYQTLRDSVCNALENYFRQVESEHISDLYRMVLSEVEAPLLKAVMQNTRSNQTKASIMLGLNRGTLRKKLKQYGML